MNSGIRTYTTEGLRPPKRVEYWNDWVGNHITSIETTPADLNAFNGRLLIGDCSAITIADAISTPACNSHAANLLKKSTDRSFLMHLQRVGASFNSQDGREILLRKGDFTLCDSARTFAVSFRNSHRILVVRIPANELERRLPHIENLTCIRMPKNQGINGVVSRLAQKYWTLCQEGLDPIMQDRIATNFLDLLATSYSDIHNIAVAESSLTASRRLLVREFIEQHLSDPDLSPSAIARRLGYTTSYIHQLFKAENESISHYIIRRRLEKASKVLADENFSSRTIGEIACDWGFNSLTHFGRAFKDQYGVTPSDFRHACRNAPEL